MKKYENNPRQIKESKLKTLHKNLEDLGDLSGITHDETTDEIITGNQRSTVFDINNCKIEITEEMKEPNEQGTIALGYVIWEGKRYSYRKVRWNEDQRKRACIVANISSGEWDFGEGKFAEFGEDNLVEWGVSSEFLPAPKFKPSENGGDPEITEYPDDDPDDIGHIRMIQLFLNKETKPIIAKHEDHLRKVYKTENISDTIYNAVKEIYTKHKRLENA